MSSAFVDRRLLLQAALLSPALTASGAGVAHAAADDDIVVIAEMNAKPGQADALRDVMLAFAAASHQQPGNKHYRILEDRQTAGRFFTFEVWADPSALDAHMHSPAAAAAFPKIADLLAGPPSLSNLKLISDT